MRFVLLGIAASWTVAGVYLSCTPHLVRVRITCFLSAIAFSFCALAVP
jgi:hypothetical protein